MRIQTHWPPWQQLPHYFIEPRYPEQYVPKIVARVLIRRDGKRLRASRLCNVWRLVMAPSVGKGPHVPIGRHPRYLLLTAGSARLKKGGVNSRRPSYGLRWAWGLIRHAEQKDYARLWQLRVYRNYPQMALWISGRGLFSRSASMISLSPTRAMNSPFVGLSFFE